jgi:hypothetical protein
MFKLRDKYVLIIIFAVLAVLAMRYFREPYRPQGSDYRYGFVDTNPTRRTSQFFDNCSPENMEDCKRNNPYEGLPLP